MTIQLTGEQWADVQRGETPVKAVYPARNATFVLVRADVYERFKSLIEDDPVTEQERLFQLQQFGKRAGWTTPKWTSTTISTPAADHERLPWPSRVGLRLSHLSLPLCPWLEF
jgi:hypothetical protein